MPTRRLLSLIVPIFSEESTIPEFYQRVKTVLTALFPKYRHEIVFVNDGSTDRSLDCLRNLSEHDSSSRVISLSRNFGHQFAITAGLDNASGDAAIIIDGDLQDPPELIPELVRQWELGYKVVYGIRNTRRGESVFKRLTAKAFYRFIRSISDTDLPVDAGDFRLLDRDVILALRIMREENRYIRGLVSWSGFRQIGVLYDRDRRFSGKTKIDIRKMIKFAVDATLSFSDRPLRLTAYLGFLVTTSAFVMAARILVQKLRFPGAPISGWTSLILAIIFMGGIQLISLGVLGLYLGRQYREIKKRPLYIVAEMIGFDEEEQEEEHKENSN